MQLYDLPTSLKDDLLTLVCGEYLGAGCSRQVYWYNSDTVIKIEVGKGWHQNAKEWHVWESVKNCEKLSPWFAPCIRMSDLCVYLLQARTQPVTLRELQREVPKVPVMFTDLKIGNWGRLGDRIVCHDYGSCLATEYGMSYKMKTAKWWAPE